MYVSYLSSQRIVLENDLESIERCGLLSDSEELDPNFIILPFLHLYAYYNNLLVILKIKVSHT